MPATPKTAAKKKSAASKKKKAPAKKKTASKKKKSAPATKMYGVGGTKATVRRKNANASRCSSGFRATGSASCPSGMQKRLNGCCIAISRAQTALDQAAQVAKQMAKVEFDPPSK